LPYPQASAGQVDRSLPERNRPVPTVRFSGLDEPLRLGPIWSVHFGGTFASCFMIAAARPNGSILSDVQLIVQRPSNSVDHRHLAGR